MRSYKWEEKYEVGFKPIDSQHKSILRLINRLVVNKSRDQRLVICLLDEFLCYVQYHFKSEENYMLMYGYGEYKAHVIEHAILIKDIIELFDKFKNGQVKLDRLAEALVKWSIPHILEVDKIVGRFLANATAA